MLTMRLLNFGIPLVPCAYAGMTRFFLFRITESSRSDLAQRTGLFYIP
jgi:hypothetical protein